MQESALLGGETHQGRAPKQYVRTTSGQRKVTPEAVVQAPAFLAASSSQICH